MMSSRANKCFIRLFLANKKKLTFFLYNKKERKLSSIFLVLNVHIRLFNLPLQQC